MLRDAVAEDVEALARLRFDGWQDAHAEVLPAELRRLPTPASFRERLREGLAGMRVAQRGGAAVGFAMLKGDELYQFYVDRGARQRGCRAAPGGCADAAGHRGRGDGVARLRDRQ